MVSIKLADLGQKHINLRKYREIMKVKGIAYWAAVQQPNTRFTPVWCVDLVFDDAVAKELTKLGLKPKKHEEGYVYKFKRNVRKSNGEENKKPVVRDINNNDFNGLIGNGSEVIVQFNPYEWENNFGKGISADFQGIQVLNLIPYGGEDGDEFESESKQSDDEPVIGMSKKDIPFDDDIPDVL